MTIAFLHRFTSPKWVYRISTRWLPGLSISTVILLGIGILWGLAFAPPDYLQGDSYRIMFVHVPAAFLAQAIYMAIALCGAIYLIWHIKLAAMAAKALAHLGASFTLIALITGALWGKPTWGTWWVWDARLTSMLILLFLYLGLIALQTAIMQRTLAAKATAILALVGVVNIPIIKYSVTLWNTLHQPATLSLLHKPAMAPAMWIPLVLCIVGFYLLALVIFLLRLRSEILIQEHKTAWVNTLLQER